MRSTTNIFLEYCDRKLEAWKDAPVVIYSELPDAAQEALKKLPRIVGKSRPMMDDTEHFGLDVAIEFLVSVGDKLYYVDTEGYNYARYVFRIYGMEVN